MPSGAPAAPEPLTQRQHGFMLALQRRMAANPDRGVSFEELRLDLGLSSKSGVSRLVQECVDRGRIVRRKRSPRSLRIVAPVSELDMPEVPLRPTIAIQSFSDADILLEASRRGLIRA